LIAEEPTFHLRGGITSRLAGRYAATIVRYIVYTSMPHPLFGARDAVISKKKMTGNLKAFLVGSELVLYSIAKYK
tara:strand:- start:253 stop:477 length:225 start_codon:yes stop_codon:yes gene_type:complete